MNEIYFLYVCLAAGAAAVHEALRDAPLGEETEYGFVYTEQE